MNPYEGLNEFFKEHNKRIRQITEALNPMEQLQSAIKASIVLPRIELPKFELPQIEFPKIELTKIEINYEKIERIVEHNSLNGWTITGEMDVNFYLNEELLGLESNKIDNLFVGYYESDNRRNYLMAKTVILSGIEDRWGNALNDCFELYEAEKYRVIIPLLITIIEGEISDITESHLFGSRLLKEWEEKILSEQEKMLIIISHSLYKYLSGKMFKPKPFAEERGLLINRNWILHGRDNPNLWTKVDVLKLINALSTFQFIKSK
ncbi:hypothetical protein [Sporosarcina sp. G11-34]|uniref:hypothetical protein n=1 Tax=Sporosarcina sp. G11-34 TaxID=2849605 RepID=UPI0022A8FFF8|nr:hypothetical protein [Sporosarcina sp. G11-34]MCZ2259847.1 hypothetical protein [Sporosarcina sp. G11-34]